jgi:hypothetical protein
VVEKDGEDGEEGMMDELDELDMQIGKLRGEAPTVAWLVVSQSGVVMYESNTEYRAKWWLGGEMAVREEIAQSWKIERCELWMQYSRRISITSKLFKEIQAAGCLVTITYSFLGAAVLITDNTRAVLGNGTGAEIPEAASRAYLQWKNNAARQAGGGE